MSERLTHLDEHGRARMVDVSDKPPSRRSARARALVRMSSAAAQAVQNGSGPKGEVLAVARLAGIQAAKQAGNLIPLAHPLSLTYVDVEARVEPEQGLVELVAEARTTAETGVEMEAMTAAAVAALTVYDMVKGLERGIEIEQVTLLEKLGGRSDYRREAPSTGPPAGTGAEGLPSESAPFSGRSPLGAAAVVTISTSKAAGEGIDESGPRLAALAERLGLEVLAREILPDDRTRIEELLRDLCNQQDCRLILTSGGTGLGPDDVTPEATRAVIEREAPGLGEAMRQVSRPHTGNWMLSRGLAGTRGRTLIVNLPGNPAGVDQIGEAIAAPLVHALRLIAGEDAGHGSGGPRHGGDEPGAA